MILLNIYLIDIKSYSLLICTSNGELNTMSVVSELLNISQCIKKSCSLDYVSSTINTINLLLNKEMHNQQREN